MREHGHVNQGESQDQHEAAFDPLWARVTESWEDEVAHQHALSYALEHDRLADIAGRYRALLEDPVKSARAKKQIAVIVVTATQLLVATKTPARVEVPWRWTASVAACCFVVVAFLAYKVLRHR